MIISASYRTDIPAYFGAWFMAGLARQYVTVKNPFNNRDYSVSLAPADVDGFVFWTRNIAPFLASLDELHDAGHPFMVQYTVTGYPAAIERATPHWARGSELMQLCAERYGRKSVVWRYDPVFLTSLTPPDWHLRRFAELATALAGATDEVVLSFAQIYAKTRVNSDNAARRHGFAWSDPEPEAKIELLGRLAALARDRGLAPSLCSQPELSSPGLAAARCIDAARLSDVAGRPIAAPTKGNRPGCLCAQSRDIGAYDTCPHGCVYCYAVRRPEVAKARHRAHDHTSPVL